MTAIGQKSPKELKAEKYFERYSYYKAIERYEEIDGLSTEGTRNLAESYRRTGNTEKAEEMYSVVAGATDNGPEDLFMYAEVLKMNGKHKQADVWMEKFHEAESTDSRGVKYHNNLGAYEKLKKDEGRFTNVLDLSINSEQEDFGATFYKNQVVFASSREGVKSIRRKWNWNKLPFLDLYVADKASDNELSNPTQLSKKLNAKYHEGPAVFSQDGNYMIFTRNNYGGKSSEGVVKLQLFESSLDAEGKWSEAQPLPYNNDEYSVGHAALSADGNTLYFSSDMPGGKGGVDIYMAEKNSDGTWGDAKNMGETINTEGNEMFPFIHKEGLLFFASDGHVGLGGLDVFVVQLKKDGKLSKVKNVGYPINGEKDDFAFIIDQNMENGYFSSNRGEGKGDDDIFSFKMTKPFTFGKTLKGVTKDKKGNILAGAQVVLKDAEGNEVETITTDEDGTYEFSVPADKDWTLAGTKEKYFDGDNTASTATDEEVVVADLVLEKDPGLSLYALVTDKKTGDPLEGVTMTIVDNMTGKEETFTTPATGDYRRPLADKKLNDRGSYQIILQKEGYFPRTVTYNTEFDKEGQYDVHGTIDLAMEVEVKDISELVQINPINFDLNKYKIRPDAEVELNKIVEVMNKYPNMVVELGSHTDSRGSDSYNRWLSDKRAKASAAYIKSKITNPDNIYGKGYGESKLLNHCKNGVKCDEADHEKNRRTEFKVISTGSDKLKVNNTSTDSFDE